MALPGKWPASAHRGCISFFEVSLSLLQCGHLERLQPTSTSLWRSLDDVRELLFGSFWSGECSLQEFEIFDNVLNEMTTLNPFSNLCREAKCNPCARLYYVRVLLHMQSAKGKHIGAKMIILEIAWGSQFGPSLRFLAFCSFL